MPVPECYLGRNFQRSPLPSLKEVIRWNPADPAVEAYRKGYACLEEEEFDAAIAAFTQAIRLNPKLAQVYSWWRDSPTL